MTLLTVLAIGIALTMLMLAAFAAGWSSASFSSRLRALEVGVRSGADRQDTPTTRIVVADLRERLRRLEQIASGIEP